MTRFYKVKINDLWLSSNGTNGANTSFCKLSISNVEDLLTDYTGSLTPTAAGELIPQIVPWTKGKSFEIAIASINKVQFDDLKTLINNSVSGDALTVQGTGDTGNFTVAARPAVPKPLSADRFLNGRIYAVTLRFYTV